MKHWLNPPIQWAPFMRSESCELPNLVLIVGIDRPVACTERGIALIISGDLGPRHFLGQQSFGDQLRSAVGRFREIIAPEVSGRKSPATSTSCLWIDPF
jgi:hypothetical protein